MKRRSACRFPPAMKPFLTIAGGKPGVNTAYTAVSTMKAQPNNLEKTLSLPGFMLLHTQ